ncbi:hypothetical protein PR001_g22042 [Phytophthora rubi]|uniref:Uncharacterized protein n=1 Tax=Phytophthora rubi TaxID=129364 RepID=A0A6A3IZI0_9STRA|nr:hypothetical protein PR001_g22042 [Phytophthora rubi]
MAKRVKSTPHADSTPEAGPRAWLRSGRNYAHPLIVEAATIQVRYLSDFVLSTPSEANTSGSQMAETASSQSTLTEPPWSPTPSIAAASSHASPLATSSQAETVAPWTPQRLNSREVHEVYDVPRWFSEVFDSDGYDSETLSVLAPYKRATPKSPSTPRPRPPRQAKSASSSVASSPGFTIVFDTSLRSARDEWNEEPWPGNVKMLTSQMNPRNWMFASLATGIRGGVGCGGVDRCNALGCLNARCGRFCTTSNCAFAGVAVTHCRRAAGWC